MTILQPLKEKRINIRNITILIVQIGLGMLFFAFYYTILQEYRRLNIESDTIAHINGALSLMEHLKNGLKGISEFKETASYSHLISLSCLAFDGLLCSQNCLLDNTGYSHRNIR